MSYDFEIRSDDKYHAAVTAYHANELISQLNGLIKTTNFTYEYDIDSLYFGLYLEFFDEDDENIDLLSIKKEVREISINCIRIVVPYGFFDKQKLPEYIRIGLRIAQLFDWRLYDLQEDVYITN